MAIHKYTKEKRAIKIFIKKKFNKQQLEKIMEEVKILGRIDHPNIIRVFEFYEDRERYYIIQELCQGE